MGIATGEGDDVSAGEIVDEEVVAALCPARTAVGAEGDEPAVGRKGGVLVIKEIIRQGGQFTALAVEEIKVAAAAEGETGEDQTPAVRRP